MAWRVGMKVVCVDASDRGFTMASWGADIPVEGEIYTVLDVLDCYGIEGLLLKEIRNTPDWMYAYNSDRFRPLVERKTDISFAHEILRTVTKTAPVDPAFERALADAGYMPTDRYVERNRT